MLSAGWTMFNCLAARVTLPSCARQRKYCICLKSIPEPFGIAALQVYIITSSDRENQNLLFALIAWAA
jgi:hypothetical protein